MERADSREVGEVEMEEEGGVIVGGSLLVVSVVAGGEVTVYFAKTASYREGRVWDRMKGRIAALRIAVAML